MSERPKIAVKPGWKRVNGVWEHDPSYVETAPEAPKRRGRVPGTVPAPEKPIHAMANARVLDIEAFQKFKAQNLTMGRIAKWMGVTPSTVKQLFDGVHWQQDGEKIRLFNEYRGCSLPDSGERMGFAAPDVIERFGGASGKRKVQRTPGEQWTVDAVKRAGVHPDQAVEVAQKMAALAGTDVPITERLDTQYFLEMTETKLAKFYRALNDQVIATMSGNDLVKGISTLVEKRALLRGEPTQIVSHRQRAKIDEVLPLLVEAARKRGITIDVTPKVIPDAS